MLLICFSQISATSLNKTIIEKLTTKHGLTNNAITVVKQGPNGFLWIGTLDGLNRYDGFEILQFRHQPDNPYSIPHNAVTDMMFDSKGRLWIGTGSGLAYMDVTKSRENRFHLITTKSINCMSEDKCNHLWFGTDNGLFILDSTGNNTSFSNHLSRASGILPSDRIRAICADRSGGIWAATEKMGMLRIKTNDYLNFNIKRINTNTIPAISSNCVISIYEDSQGRLWTGSVEGKICFLNSNRQRVHSLPLRSTLNARQENTKRIQWIMEGKEGSIWIASNGNGLYKIDPHRLEVVQFFTTFSETCKLSNDAVLCVYQDESDVIWAGTNGGGINAIKSRSFPLYHWEAKKDSSSLGNNIWVIKEAPNGKLWAGSDFGLLEFKNRSVSGYASPEPFLKINKTIRTGCAIHDLLWLNNTVVLAATTGKGIAQINLKTNTVSYFPGAAGDSLLKFVYTLARDSLGKIWVGTNGAGLARFDPDNKTFKIINQALNSGNKINWVTTLSASNKRPAVNMLVGTWGMGIWHLDIKDYTLNPIPYPATFKTTPASAIIFSIHKAPNGNLWLATYGNGLIRFNPRDKTLKTITIEQGLANNVIYGILEDRNNYLWLSSNNGLMRFDLVSDHSINFSPENGLLNSEFNLGAAYVSQSGFLLFGGTRGIDAVYPYGELNQKPPRLFLKSINADGKIIQTSIGSSLRFDHGIRQIDFELTALHFKNPAQNRYAYYLEGYNHQWQYIHQERKMHFHNLPDGRYRLMAKSANCDGFWSDPTELIVFEIVPPYWKQIWFKLFLFAALLLGIWAFQIFKLRKRLILERVRYDEKVKLKKKISADFHDELGHRITTILLMSKMLRTKIKGNKEGETILEHLIDNSDKLFLDLRSFLWELDEKRSTLDQIILQLKTFSEELFDDTHISFVLRFPDRSLSHILIPTNWRRQILPIFKEAMNNILKHAAGDRCVQMKVDLNGNEFSITLTDDGKGFDVNNITSINGINNMKTRADSIGASIEIKSTTGRTSVIFKAKLPERIV